MNENEQSSENLLYAITCIGEVAMERQNIEVCVAIKELRYALSTLNMLPPVSNVEQFKGIRLIAHRIASDLLAAVKFGIREVLVPFIEVKRSTHKFGNQTFPDYFRWLSPEKQYAPEILVGILEEQARMLSIALEHLRKS